MQETDEFLIQHVASGDALAYTELDNRWRKKIAAFALRKVGGNVADAEDIAQVVMVKVWQRAKTFRPENGSFGVWIKRLAGNAIVDEVRRQGRAKRGGGVTRSEYHDEQTDAQEENSEPVYEQSDIEALHVAIQQLPAKFRRVCRAMLRQETVEHTSATTACARATVQSHRAIAIQRIREMLRKRGDGSLSVAAVEQKTVQLTLFGETTGKVSGKQKVEQTEQKRLFS